MKFFKKNHVYFAKMYMSIVYALVNVKKKLQKYVQEKYIFLKILQMYGKPLHIMRKNVLQRFNNYKYFDRGNFFGNFLALFLPRKCPVYSHTVIRLITKTVLSFHVGRVFLSPIVIILFNFDFMAQTAF